jgi:hypothetical protein
MEAVKKFRSWFESLTTNGFHVRGFKELAVRPEHVEGRTAIFSQLHGMGGGLSPCDGFLDLIRLDH